MQDTMAMPSTKSARTTATDPLATMKRRTKRKVWPWIVGILVIASAGGGWAYTHRPKPPIKYVTAQVSKGDVLEHVEATGTVQPITQVLVGSQVSGRIAKIYVDFNVKVKKGDLLAEIDPVPFIARVEQAKGNLASAMANRDKSAADLALARRMADRAKELRQRELNSIQDLDSALAAQADAVAQVGVSDAVIRQTRAALQSAQSDLNYTQIRAPMDGIVVTRSVDVGQTVAASFTTPTLFLIVDDLAHMQVLGDVDEADIGKLQEGSDVDVHVDAFPDQSFPGHVTTLRYNSTNTQGVVTYPAVIGVDNTARKLRPGMTATISVVTSQAHDVFRVPNAALRYRPKNTTGEPEGTGTRTAQQSQQAHRGHIYLQEGSGETQHIRRIDVITGITDGRYTQVTSDELRVDQTVVIDEPTTPVPGAPPSGGGSGGGGGSKSGGPRAPRMF